MEYVLWTFQQLREIEQMDEIRKDMDAIDQAGLTSVAMWEPKRLQGERQRVERRVREFSADPAERAPVMSVAELQAWATEQAARIAAARLFGDGGEERQVQ